MKQEMNNLKLSDIDNAIKSIDSLIVQQKIASQESLGETFVVRKPNPFKINNQNLISSLRD
jgi:hypothetical protein